jgi:hypothetical protein
MFCSECGKTISETAKFCENCGASIGKAAPVQSPVVSSAKSTQEVAVRRQLALPTFGGSRLAATAALVGCGVTLAGLFTPWTTLAGTLFRYGQSSVSVSESYSIWDWIGHAQGYDVQLQPQPYHWLVLIGALIAIVGVLPALMLPGLKPSWVITLAGSTLTILGVVWALAHGNEVVSLYLYAPTVSRGYGMFLALAGGLTAFVASLLGLAMLTDFYRQRVSPTP